MNARAGPIVADGPRAISLARSLIGYVAGNALARRTRPVFSKRLTAPRKEEAVDRHAAVDVQGTVSDGFEGVRDAFVENFARRHELGGACSVYHRGRKVVDLWGGIRNKRTGEPWERDTTVIVHSATKGLAAMTLALAHSRGWLDYEAPVSAYWPAFAEHGKASIRVRQLLAHQAGLFAIDEPVDRAALADFDRLFTRRPSPAAPRLRCRKA
jgi:CubicO group peptidase (beta-lactamase class C family)